MFKQVKSVRVLVLLSDNYTRTLCCCHLVMNRQKPLKFHTETIRHTSEKIISSKCTGKNKYLFSKIGSYNYDPAFYIFSVVIQGVGPGEHRVQMISKYCVQLIIICLRNKFFFYSVLGLIAWNSFFIVECILLI